MYTRGKRIVLMFKFYNIYNIRISMCIRCNYLKNLMQNILYSLRRYIYIHLLNNSAFSANINTNLRTMLNFDL